MVTHEWDIETMDGDEVADHLHADKLKELHFPTLAHNEVLVLVRDSEIHGRAWAYVDDSKMLPKFFTEPNEKGEYVSNGIAVPQRFHREIARVVCGGR